MRKIMITVATTVIVSLSLYAANMASQPWVELKLSQQTTSLKEWVIRYIAEHGGGLTTNGVTTAWVSNYVQSCNFKREEGKDYSTNTVQGIWNNIQLQIALARASTNYVQEVAE